LGRSKAHAGRWWLPVGVPEGPRGRGGMGMGGWGGGWGAPPPASVICAAPWSLDRSFQRGDRKLPAGTPMGRAGLETGAGGNLPGMKIN